VVWNLLETEQNYAKQLGIIQNIFRKRLLERKIISEHSAYLIFFGIGIQIFTVAELLELHSSFCKQLEKLIQTWNTNETRIGRLFLAHVEELKKCYARFIDNYAISVKCIKKEEKENPEYVQFIREVSRLQETNRSTLKDYLIFPVQRTTRYHLLLKGLLM
jgi:hypothetical protein